MVQNSMTYFMDGPLLNFYCTLPNAGRTQQPPEHLKPFDMMLLAFRNIFNNK